MLSLTYHSIFTPFVGRFEKNINVVGHSAAAMRVVLKSSHNYIHLW